MRKIHVDKITENIKEMCIEANLFLTEDMKQALSEAAAKEENPLGVQILEQLKENLAIAGRERIPICQDTGMAVVFVKIGQEVYIEGGSLEEAIHFMVDQHFSRYPIYEEDLDHIVGILNPRDAVKVWLTAPDSNATQP